MLKITRLADYAVIIICSFRGKGNIIISAKEISKKTSIKTDPRFVAPSIEIIKQISKKTSINKATVNKILSILVRKKILTASRGVNGGYKTVKQLDKISIKELIEAIEGPVALTNCMDNNAGDCNLFDQCVTKNTWGIVNNVIKDALEGIKVLDIPNASTDIINTTSTKI